MNILGQREGSKLMGLRRSGMWIAHGKGNDDESDDDHYDHDDDQDDQDGHDDDDDDDSEKSLSRKDGHNDGNACIYIEALRRCLTLFSRIFFFSSCDFLIFPRETRYKDGGSNVKSLH